MRTAVTIVLLCISTITFAQKVVPALERMVTLTVYNEPVHRVLEKISAQTGVKFSYNPATVKVDKKVSFVASKKPVRTLLTMLFDESVQTKQNGNYIILTYKVIKPSSKEQPIKNITISGYIYSTTGTTLDAVSIYNTDNMVATVSNEYGYYDLSIPANKLPITVKVAKKHYNDTNIRISSNKTSCDIVLYAPPLQTPPIAPDTPTATNSKTPVKVDTLQSIAPDTISRSPVQTFLQNLVLSEKLKSSMRNIKDTVFSKAQFSLVPYVSTNKLLSANSINDYSFNLLIGYSQGVNVFEIGGLMNIDRGDVKYAQVAGLLNADGGTFKGAQVAGIGNITRGKVDGVVVAGILNAGTHLEGVQVAGITNFNLSIPDTFNNSRFHDFILDTVKGVQVAGISNINAGYSEGVRIAGILNLGHINKGVQVAGILNSNIGISSGVNIGGILNYTHDTLIGSNIGGIANINRKYVEGVQAAGILNIAAQNVKGVQISSIVNMAKQVTGTQIALLNFSDSLFGLPIGLLSYVNSGYHKIELFGDDVIYTQLAFRTGVSAFHNIFTIGVDLTKKLDGVWNLGYGIGSTVALAPKWNFTTDLIAQSILHKTDFENAPLLGNLFVGIERRFSPSFSVALGPTYHALLNFGTQNVYTDLTPQLIPYSFSQTTFDNGNTLNMWVGGKISFKFL